MDNSRNELLCLNAIWIYVPALAIGIFLMGGFLPPPGPTTSAAELSRIFSPDNTLMRSGMMLALLTSCVFAFPMAAIAAQLRRMEGPNAVLAPLFNVMSALTCVCNFLPCAILMAISYRPDILPDVKVVFIDLAWFMFLGGIWTQIPLNLIQGIGILTNKSGLDIYPRWMGFLNILLVLTFLPDVLMPMFQKGPFTYSGILGFWVPANGYFMWIWFNYGFTLRAIRRQRAAHKAALA